MTVRDADGSSADGKNPRLSEAWMRAAFASLVEGVVFLNVHGEVEDANPAAQRMYGDALAELNGLSRDSRFRIMKADGAPFPEDERPAIVTLRTGLPARNVEMGVLRPGGNLQWLLVNTEPLRDDGGRLIGAAVSFQDTTPLKDAQADLRRQKERMQVALEAGALAAWDIDLASGRVWRSELHDRIFGYETPRAEWTQETFMGHVVPEFRESLTRKMREAIDHGSRVSSQCLIRRTDGEIRWIEVLGCVIRDATGRPRDVFGVTRDITDQKRNEEFLTESKARLERHAEELEAAVAQRTSEMLSTIHDLESFSYSLSHDMKAPLRAIKGFSQILLAQHGDRIGRDGAQYLERINGAATRMDRLIDDILVYGRVAREKATMVPIALDLLLRQLIEEDPSLQPPQAVIEILSPLPPVMGHRGFLTQVLSNLIRNSVKFVAPGTQPRVRIWAENAGPDLEICLEDNGIGIPAEAQTRLFGMFERAHPGAGYEGTGIGLAIVRKAVERMGGSIRFVSEEGKGTRFCIRLRRAE